VGRREVCEYLLKKLPVSWTQMVSGPDVDDDWIEILLDGQVWILRPELRIQAAQRSATRVAAQIGEGSVILTVGGSR